MTNTTDTQNIWHPFTNNAVEKSFSRTVVKANGAYLIDDQNNEIIDAISSWWCNIHGHCHPHIADAISKQAQTLDHVMFARITHQPAITLVEKLKNFLPQSLSHYFFSDNGSTAIEVALKMALHFWRNKGEVEKKTFLCLKGSYHGDTVGAMSVSFTSGFFDSYSDLTFPVKSIDVAYVDDDENITQEYLKQAQTLFEKEHQTIAAIIIEPLVQGASGMKMYSPSFLDDICKAAKHYNIPIIFDEVMTGFGRTGKMFAFEHISTTPDIVCLSKGLTGGFLPLSLTVCAPHIFDSFTHSKQMFVHGHTYTANPIACAAAIASIELFESNDYMKKITQINEAMSKQISALKQKHDIKNIRSIGGILAFDFPETIKHNAATNLDFSKHCWDAGALVRPLGKTIYVLPPYCITPAQIETVFDAIDKSLCKLT